ncbi:MAG TPA: hypothetical protein VNQ77_16435 [Frankiaceae bacterium]|nr:hypothetical protein [Frankiaceae bacterium]
MRALVVYESLFGNTLTVARAVAEGVARHLKTETVEAGNAPTVLGDDVALLVAGGPTHAFGLSRQSTRASAVEQGATGASETGLREWLDALAPGSAAAATFDTRVRRPRVPGSAANAAERRLRGKGYVVVRPAETFWVGGTPGPLLPGEVERARAWGASVAAAATAAGVVGGVR